LVTSLPVQPILWPQKAHMLQMWASQSARIRAPHITRKGSGFKSRSQYKYMSLFICCFVLCR
jgi:hypothetical protein